MGVEQCPRTAALVPPPVSTPPRARSTLKAWTAHCQKPTPKDILGRLVTCEGLKGLNGLTFSGESRLACTGNMAPRRHETISLSEHIQRKETRPPPGYTRLPRAAVDGEEAPQGEAPGAARAGGSHLQHRACHAPERPPDVEMHNGRCREEARTHGSMHVTPAHRRHGAPRGAARLRSSHCATYPVLLTTLPPAAYHLPPTTYRVPPTAHHVGSGRTRSNTGSRVAARSSAIPPCGGSSAWTSSE